MFRLSSVSRAAMILCLGSVAVGACAQQQTAQAQQPAKQLQRVEVTGSNIKRLTTETAAPITVITREDMVKSGASTLADVMAKLTVAQGGLSGVEFSGFSPGAATIALRGLGAGATLILINGRRIAPYGISGFQEIITSINSIPVTAIDRIDILKDGASAIYGSEAIAGVVNIILRSDYRGFEAQANTTFNNNHSLKVHRLGLSGGIGEIATDRYNVFATYEHLQQDSMLVGQNAFYPTRNLASFTGSPADDRRSAYSYPGNFLTSAVKTLPGCAPKNIRRVGANDRCVLDVFEYNTAAPKANRDSLLARGTLEISSTLSAFAELGYSRSDYFYQYDPQFYYNTGAATLLTSGAPYGVAGDVNLLYRTGDLGPRRFNVLSNETRVLAGLKGNLGDWEFNTAVGHMSDSVDVKSRGLVLIDQMESALASGSYVPGQTNASSVLAQISPELVRRGKSSTNFVDARVSTDFPTLTLKGGPVGFAAGIEARRETQSDNDDRQFVDGNVFGYGALEPLSASRNVQSAFAELSLPILSTLEAQLAARHDRYSVGGTSTTPKAGVKWTVLPTLVLRGTYAQGFRAANAREVAPNVSVGFYNGVQDPVRCPDISPANPDCNLSVQANISGNPKLEPEKSKSYTLGLVFEPVKDTNISIDLWKIARTNEITNLSIDYLLNNQSVFSSYIQRDGTGSITEVNLPYVNLAGTTVRGADVDLRTKHNLGEAGKLSFIGRGTYYHDFMISPAPGAEWENYNGTYAQPRWRANASLGWEKGPWTTELSYNHVGSFLNKGSPSGVCSAPASQAKFCTVNAWDTFGLFVGYKGFKNIELGLSIDNLTDKAPPFDYRAAVNSQTRAWTAVYHNANGRTVNLRAAYSFKAL